ncbi:hypothetical protein INT43_007238 [Umbelopsis isabellina]|uniref:Btz domain-containing protein n=1 Tax=Mortierella isabellina TaxID=91625 RepID=A0A8H7Q065_MORIS|nr:hypothetical protein INT43_007238 [Umbelopsis isabellina]
MLQSRYHRRKQVRDTAESDAEAEHSDSSSGSADLAESSGSSVESEGEMSGDEGEEQPDSVPAGKGDQHEAIGGADSWGSPPKAIDNDLSWGAASKPETDTSQSWQETAAAFKAEDVKDTPSKQDDARGGSDKRNTGFGGSNEKWKNRQTSDGARRGRGSAPRPARGVRGGPRGGGRGAHSQPSDRPYMPEFAGKPRGGGRPNRGRGGRGAGHTWSNRDESNPNAHSTASWDKPSATKSSLQKPDSWETVPQTETKLDSDSTWGAPEPVPANKSNDDGWGEAAKAEDEKKSELSESTDNWTDPAAKLDQSSDMQPSNDSEASPTNEASQRRVNARREYRKKLEEDPSFVPHLGEFWSHDDRFRDEEMKNTNDRGRGRGGFRGRGRGRGGADVAGRSSPAFAATTDTRSKWNHDGYESLLKTEERDEQRRRDRLERMDRKPEDGLGRFFDNGSGPQRGRGRGFRGGRGRGGRGGSSSRQSPGINPPSQSIAEVKSTSQEMSLTADLDALRIQEKGNGSQSTSRKKAIKDKSANNTQTDSNNADNADEDSDVEIILEAPTWQSEQVLGIPTPKSTGSEKSSTGEDAAEASTSQNGVAAKSDNDGVKSPNSNWGTTDPELMDKAASWQQHPEFSTQSNEHQYPTHNMLSPNAVQFVPMTTMGGSPHNMMPMQPMYAVPMNMSGSREGTPGPIMYAPMMNSQQNMFEANGMFYYGYDPSQMSQMSQMPMYTPVMYYPQSSAPQENERAYSSPKWNNSRKYTQQDRSRGKQNTSSHHSQH